MTEKPEKKEDNRVQISFGMDWFGFWMLIAIYLVMFSGKPSFHERMMAHLFPEMPSIAEVKRP